MTCLFTVERCQSEGELKPYGFNWTIRLARRWTANTPLLTGEPVRPTTEELQTGFEYEPTDGQSSGASEPTWPAKLGKTVVSGSSTLTTTALTEDSLLETIATSDWDVPTGLTASSPSYVATAGLQATEIHITGGVPGETYTIVNEITTSEGNEYQAVILLEIDES